MDLARHLINWLFIHLLSGSYFELNLLLKWAKRVGMVRHSEVFVTSTYRRLSDVGHFASVQFSNTTREVIRPSSFETKYPRRVAGAS
jgi:hypothetical protein